MNRRDMIEWCKRSPDIWDVIIIGGGATGLGTAVDAASRGYKTLLLEQSDFAKGTSSRSTKLIHGGLRYLKQGNIGLVIEALKERGLLCKNAPHLVNHLGFLLPFYRWWEKPFYTIGLKLYDLLSGSLGLEKSHLISKEELQIRFPTVRKGHLQGGAVFYDGQFDDARLAITLAQTAEDLGGVVVNYMSVTGLIKEEERVVGVEAEDLETGDSYRLRAKVVINATGPFSDVMRKLDHPAEAKIVPSQGIHLVLDRKFMPGDLSLLIPETEDGRILFFIPWHRHLLVGTTDTPVSSPALEPIALDREIDYLLKYAGTYLTHRPTRSDVLSVFAGIRPLGKKGGIKDTIYNQVEHAPGIVGNPPYCGMDFIYGLEDNDTYFKGNIVDPQQGKVYVSEVWAENGTLKVRGKLWVFGKTMTWYPAEASDFPKGFKLPDLDSMVPVIPQTK